MAESATNVATFLVDRLQSRSAEVRLPRHEVWMLRQGFEQLLDGAIDERDSFYNSLECDDRGVPLSLEEAQTLCQMDYEILRAQRTLRQFDKVFHG